MPITGEIDVSAILNELGDPDHGLVAAKPINPGGDDVFRASWGDLDMSTSMTLAVIDSPIWDVNGYYRSLGFEQPFKPTKNEMRIAYMESGGMDDEFQTYALKQLIDKKTRLLYDRAPLGSRFRDKYVILEEQKKLIDIAQEMSEEEGRLVTVKEVEERLGDPNKRDREQLNTEDQPSYYWDWGYYLFRSRKPEVEDLIEWQRLLTRAFHEEGLARTIAIGYIGKTDAEFTVRQHDNRTVIFLHEDTIPTPELAKRAVASYTAHQTKGSA